MSQMAGKSELSIVNVEIVEDMIKAKISDGRIVLVPITWFPRLTNATPANLRKFEISPSGYGVHWPELDEDISIKSFIS